MLDGCERGSTVVTELHPWSGFDSLVNGLIALRDRTQEAAARSVDEILTMRNWLIGVWIVAFEQEGADRASYGAALIDSLAKAFKSRGVRGLGASNLKNYRQIALTWPRLGIRQTSGEFEAWQALSSHPVPSVAQDASLPWQDDDWMLRLCRELSFSHLLELARVSDPLGRAFYEVETLRNRWSVRELRRQREAMLFERVGLSRDKDAVLALAAEGRLVDTPLANLRDPYVLEFLGLAERRVLSEADLEAALVDHLQEFLLELGGDFAFIGRQYRITVGGRHHFIDLLFFHRRLRCLVAIELKLGSFGYEDAGQMNFYLNYLRENLSFENENPPVGIVLCADKNAEEVHYATGGLDQQVFVSRYLTRLPTEEQLRNWLAEERELLARRQLERS
jgi:predicted nuclease of restriction endonuclease-like (RecB) superfamily